ncbi:LysR family transcriptional regulator (plasmid) [Thioclava litoralis]|uniref:LysR family transcriptional regulator n=1 Tax=Thioclava litoralis TaxID=3076557 RepID=A0ABZ1E2K0_9RHOB|nr:LysR family transcriptional regulator [Thioclava sp. FTW29]
MKDIGFSHLDWNLLRSFVTIAQSSSITDAAQRLCLTQPAVSGCLKRLEEQVGYRLIERSSTMFELTEAGRRLLHEAIDITAAVSRLPASLGEAEKVLTGEATIVLASHVESPEFDAALACFHQRHPQVGLTLKVEASREGLAMVAAKRADMAVCVVGDSNLQLEYTLLFQEHFGLYCGPSHPLFGREDLSVSDLNGFASVGYLAESSNRALHELTALRQRCGLKPDLVGRSHNLEEIKRMIIAGFGIGPLPVHVVERDCAAGRLWRLPPFEGTPQAGVYVVTQPAALRTRIADELHRVFSEQVAAHPPESRIYGGADPAPEQGRGARPRPLAV